MNIHETKDFSLQEEDLDRIYSALSRKFDKELILFIHTAMLFSPFILSFEKKELFDVEKHSNKNKLLCSSDIAIIMRIVGLYSMGYLYFKILKQWGFKLTGNLNTILKAMKKEFSGTDKQIDSLFMIDIIEIQKVNSNLFHEKPIIKDKSIFEEIDVCSKIMEKILSKNTLFF